MRLRRSLRKELEATAARSRRSVAEVAQELLEEALRMRQCPGIYFADEPSGRTAKIGGTGLAVWEVLRHFPEDHDPKRVRRAFSQLSQAQLTAALMYFSRYPESATPWPGALHSGSSAPGPSAGTSSTGEVCGRT